MKAIQSVLALLLLLLSATAVAKGPMKDQLVVTPPFSSTKFYQVTYLNISDHQVELEIEFFDYQGNSLGVGPVTFSPNAGEMGWFAYDLDYASFNMGYAHVSWYGNTDDLLLTACSFDDLDTPTYRSCVPAN